MTFLQLHIIGDYLEGFVGQNNHLIYIKISQRYGNWQERLVCKILKSLYSLKQAKRL